uniref:NAC domain-containing protein n=1 Tax=Panagrellus redivivus TaxID=6233 RepID=A0A7E4VD05_PANRE
MDDGGARTGKKVQFYECVARMMFSPNSIVSTEELEPMSPTFELVSILKPPSEGFLTNDVDWEYNVADDSENVDEQVQGGEMDPQNCQPGLNNGPYEDTADGSFSL